MQEIPPKGLAVVTGAGSGIGRAVAVALAKLKLPVALVGRRSAPLEQTASAIRAAGGNPHSFACDITNDKAVAALVRNIEDLGRSRLVALVHSAGLYSMAPIDQLRAEDFDSVFRCNVWGPLFLTQRLLPALRRAQGNVVFINSSAALSARAGMGAYAASKAALKAIADSLRQEVNADGVRVLSIFPGRTATTMQEVIYRNEGRTYEPGKLLQPEDVAAAVVDSMRLPRTAEVTDLQIRPAKK